MDEGVEKLVLVKIDDCRRIEDLTDKEIMHELEILEQLSLTQLWFASQHCELGHLWFQSGSGDNNPLLQFFNSRKRVLEKNGQVRSKDVSP